MRVGAAGEAIAVAFLEKKGWSIVDTNVRFDPSEGLKGELDIIAWDGPTLTFVEVKTRRGFINSVDPAENVTVLKQQQIARLALAYLTRHALFDELDADATPMRFDVIAVTLSPQPLENPKTLRIQHLRGAFLAPSDAGSW
jgi:putative endonuclease